MRRIIRTIDGRIEPGDAPGTSPRFGEMAAAIIAQADAQGCYTVGSLCRTRRGGAGH